MMSGLTEILLTAASTILGGVFIFVAGQVVARFFIEPIHDFKNLLGDIRYSLIFFAREIQTPVPGDKERCDKASEALRKHSSDLPSKAAAIPLYVYALISALTCRFIPRRILVFEASKYLMGLSNAVYNKNRSRNTDSVNKICSLLGFEYIGD